MAKTLVKIFKLKIFSIMLRMSRFIRGMNLRLRRSSPIPIGQNTCENSQTENFFKNAQNVEIYQGNKSEVAKFFHLYKMAKTLVKILKLKIIQNCSEC